MSETASHICVDGDGVAWVVGSNVKVVEVVLDKQAHGSSVEEMHFQFPHLSMAQIHAALSWYHDHKSAMDGEILQRSECVDEIAAQQDDSGFRERLSKTEAPA